MFFLLAWHFHWWPLAWKTLRNGFWCLVISSSVFFSHRQYWHIVSSATYSLPPRCFFNNSDSQHQTNRIRWLHINRCIFLIWQFHNSHGLNGKTRFRTWLLHSQSHHRVWIDRGEGHFNEISSACGFWFTWGKLTITMMDNKSICNWLSHRVPNLKISYLISMLKQ